MITSSVCLKQMNAIVAWRCSPTPCASMPSRCSRGMSRSSSAPPQTVRSGRRSSPTGLGSAAGGSRARPGHRRPGRDLLGHGGANTNLAGPRIGSHAVSPRRRGLSAGAPGGCPAAETWGSRRDAAQWRCRAAPTLRRASDRLAMRARMPCEARQALTASPSTGEEDQLTCPPLNLMTSPPSSTQMRIMEPKHEFKRSVSSSAPRRPNEESCSVRRVNPEISAETSVPGTRWHVSSGRAAIHSAASRRHVGA